MATFVVPRQTLSRRIVERTRQLQYIFPTSICRKVTLAGACGGRLEQDRKSVVGDAHVANVAFQQTENWVHRWVVDQKLCPFAKPLIDRSTLRIAISNARSIKELLEDFENELDILHSTENARSVEAVLTEEKSSRAGESASESPKPNSVGIESTLLVIVPGESENLTVGIPALEKPFLSDFSTFRYASWDLQGVIVEKQLQEFCQIVLFHPEGEKNPYEESVSADVDMEKRNFTVHSAPFPTFHLLREKDVLEAVKSFQKERAEDIPSRNLARLRKLGDDKIQNIWKQEILVDRCT